MPLQYPPMVYLGLRLAWIAIARTRAARPAPRPRGRRTRTPPAPPARPSSAARRRPGCSSTLLAVTLALRFGLNAFDSNVIDVGYAGVIGADRIAHGATPYGNDAERLRHLRHLRPAQLHRLRPVRAHPAVGRARGTASPPPTAPPPSSTSSAMAGMFALGWRISGLRLGIGLALAWAAFPFTAFALETNANDSLVAALLIWGARARAPSRSAAARCSGLALEREVRAGRAAAALEPQAVPAAGPGPQPAALRRRASPARRWRPAGCCCSTAPDGIARVLVPHDRLPARPRLAVLDLGPVPGPAPGADRR